MSQRNNLMRAREIYTPGATATGLFINLDGAKNMFVMRLLCGARGWLSTFEVPDDELDSYKIGSPITGIVDRVESDRDGNINVILKREEENDDHAASNENHAPSSLLVSVTPIGSDRENARLRLEEFADSIDALIAVDTDGVVALFLDQISGFWDFASHLKPQHIRVGVLRLSDVADNGVTTLRFTESDIFQAGMEYSVRGWFEIDYGKISACSMVTSRALLGRHIDDFDSHQLVDVSLTVAPAADQISQSPQEGLVLHSR